jgi:intracellular multiplication protein IcmK
MKKIGTIILLSMLFYTSNLFASLLDDLKELKKPSPQRTTSTSLPSSLPTVTADKKEKKQNKEPMERATKDTAPTQTTVRDEAFQQFLNKTMPLRPDQIIKLHQELDKANQAKEAHPRTPPQPVSSTLTVDLSPGSESPVIRLANGFVTSVVFVDSTGQPWPIGDYSLGNPKNFNIQWDRKTNALFIQSTAPYVTANLAVRLSDLDTPVMISLVTGQKEVDYRVDLQIKAHGPNAQAPIVRDSLPNMTSPSLLSVLDGVPPVDSLELQVSEGLGRAWLYNGKLIFRTKLTLLSPAWSATVSSPDGTRVYELMQTPLILASKNGKPIKIELTGL